MFDLEKSLAAWRKRMKNEGVLDAAALEELEAHLRDDFAALTTKGEPSERAFSLALARLGQPAAVGREFRKANGGQNRPLKAAVCFWLAVVALLAVAIGRRGPLLFLHTWSITSGYLAAFMAGGMGIASLAQSWRGNASPILQHSLVHAARRFHGLAAPLVACGFLLGLCWSAKYRGHPWSGSAREIAALGVAVWLAALALAQRFCQVSDAAAALLAVAGNAFVILAWFGPFLAQRWTATGDIGSYWIALVFMTFHVGFFIVGLAAKSPFAELKRE